MRRFERFLMPIGMLLVFMLSFSGPGRSRALGAAAGDKKYVCTPCGAPCDKTIYDAPGTCPKCGMPLVDREEIKAPAEPATKAAILIFDGVQIIDFTGPYEVFGAAGFDVYTVAATKNPVTTSMGMTVVPTYSFADAPQPDILVIPGGVVKASEEDSVTRKWIVDETGHATTAMSVCNGAFILAGTGLLDGLSATTTAGNIARLHAKYPKVKVVRDRRFVDNGKLVTTAGLSAGIDGALHVVAKLRGDGAAQQVALTEEYDWLPRSRFARAALADMMIPDVDLDGYGKWYVARTEGTVDHWEYVLRGTSDRGAAEIMKRFEDGLETGGKWTRDGAGSAKAGSEPATRWSFKDDDGHLWSGTLRLHTSTSDSHKYTAELSVARNVK